MTTAPLTSPPPAISKQSWSWHRTLISIVIALLLVTGIYAGAWYNAYRLTQRYIADADANYETGNYYDALVGYQKFDSAKGEYVTHGGYIMIQNIWKGPRAKPTPNELVQHADARINEIINEKFTLDDAEKYVRRNTGRSNDPYLGIIYLRWGELFEASGDLESAESIYEDVPESFPNDQDLIARAQADLERLNNGNS